MKIKGLSMKGLSNLQLLIDSCGRDTQDNEKLLILNQIENELLSDKSLSFISDCKREIGLSRRLLEVRDLVVSGFSNNEISKKLNISFYTVAEYIKAIFEYYLVTSRRELISGIKNGRFVRPLISDKECEFLDRICMVLVDILFSKLTLFEKRKYFMDYFLGEINASNYIWYESEFSLDMPSPKVLNFLTNLSPAQQKLFMSGASDSKYVDPYMLPSLKYRYSMKAKSYIRQQVLSDGDWYGSDYVSKYYKGCRVDHPMCYMVDHENNLHCGILIYKKWGEESFSNCELTFMTFVFERISWLFTDQNILNPDLFNGLEGKQHQILLCLLDGLSVTEIGNYLFLSEHTVNGYIRSIYRNFSVNSYSQLLAKFID